MTLGSLEIEARKVYIDEHAELSGDPSVCPECIKVGEQNQLRYFHINLSESIYKCSSQKCLFPFGNFKYKSSIDQKVYRYEPIVPTTDESPSTPPTEQIFTNQSILNDTSAINFTCNFDSEISDNTTTINNNASVNNFDLDWMDSANDSSIVDLASVSPSTDSFSLYDIISESTAIIENEHYTNAFNDNRDNNNDYMGTANGNNERNDIAANDQEFMLENYNFDEILNEICKERHIDHENEMESYNFDDNYTITDLECNNYKKCLIENDLIDDIGKEIKKSSIPQSPTPIPTPSPSPINVAKLTKSIKHIERITKKSSTEKCFNKKLIKVRMKKVTNLSDKIKIECPNNEKQPINITKSFNSSKIAFTSSKTFLSQIKNNTSDVKTQLKNIIDNKNQFRPLDLLNTINSLNLKSTQSLPLSFLKATASSSSQQNLKISNEVIKSPSLSALITKSIPITKIHHPSTLQNTVITYKPSNKYFERLQNKRINNNRMLTKKTKQKTETVTVESKILEEKKQYPLDNQQTNDDLPFKGFTNNCTSDNLNCCTFKSKLQELSKIILESNSMISLLVEQQQQQLHRNVDDNEFFGFTKKDLGK